MARTGLSHNTSSASEVCQLDIPRSLMLVLSLSLHKLHFVYALQLIEIVCPDKLSCREIFSFFTSGTELEVIGTELEDGAGTELEDGADDCVLLERAAAVLEDARFSTLAAHWRPAVSCPVSALPAHRRVCSGAGASPVAAALTVADTRFPILPLAFAFDKAAAPAASAFFLFLVARRSACTTFKSAASFALCFESGVEWTAGLELRDWIGAGPGGARAPGGVTRGGPGIRGVPSTVLALGVREASRPWTA